MTARYSRILLMGLLCLAACAKSVEEIKQESKRELLSALPDQVIIPAYQEFADAVTALQQSIKHYCGGQNGAGLEIMQEHWRSSMTAWQKTAVYAVGPVARYNLPALINYQAIRKSRLDYWLEPGRIATAEQMKNYSVQGKGLGALEYLLFESGIRRTNPQYCAYLASLAADLQANADRILQFWRAPEGIEESGAADAAGRDLQQRLDELLDAALQAMETVKDEKLGVPLGRKNKGVAQPDKVESRRSGHSLQNIRANIASLQNILLYGLAPYLNKTGNPEASAALKQKLADIILDIEKIAQPLQVAILDRPEAVEALYRDVSDLCSILETAVLPAFDVQPGFNARDGD